MNGHSRTRRSVSLFLGGALALMPAGLGAQNETALKRAFEGKRVILKIDMPATSSGVDVWPDRELPVEFSKVADRIKQNGIGIATGESQVVTKVHVVRDHIEFQLGGGGYGTFSDVLSSPYQAPPPPQNESREERRLKDEIARTTDPTIRRTLEQELGRLQRQRLAEDRAAEARVAEANRAAESEVRDRRLSAGSRFNIRYRGSVPADALTPEGVMAALAEYVDFSPMGGAAATPAGSADVAPGPGAGALALRKGLSLEEVEQLLGPAAEVSRDTSSGLEVVTRTYENPSHKVVAKFVGGVLVDFAITPH